jgi:hypothetical protein
MPQFNFDHFPSQIFWLIICFAALYFLLARTALPKIGAVLEARQRKIDDDLERATALELQAKEALVAYEAELDTARGQAQSSGTAPPGAGGQTGGRRRGRRGAHRRGPQGRFGTNSPGGQRGGARHDRPADRRRGG